MYMYEMDLALNNSQRLICHKTQASKRIIYLSIRKQNRIFIDLETWQNYLFPDFK